MKKSLLFLMFLTLPLIINGQQNYQDNVFLKNGKIITGVIIDQVLNKTIRFVNIYGDSLIFNLDEIEKLTRIQEPEERNQSNYNFYLKPRYELIVQTSLYYGIGKFGTPYYKLSIINGIRFNRKFALGFGLGLGSYPKLGLESYFQKPESKIFPLFIVTICTFTSNHYREPKNQTVADIPDEIIMKRVKDGNLAEMSVLFERYHLRLYNFFLKLTRNRDISHDLTQNLFYRMIKYKNS